MLPLNNVWLLLTWNLWTFLFFLVLFITKSNKDFSRITKFTFVGKALREMKILCSTYEMNSRLKLNFFLMRLVTWSYPYVITVDLNLVKRKSYIKMNVTVQEEQKEKKGKEKNTALLICPFRFHSFAVSASIFTVWTFLFLLSIHHPSHYLPPLLPLLF